MVNVSVEKNYDRDVIFWENKSHYAWWVLQESPLLILFTQQRNGNIYS